MMFNAADKEVCFEGFVPCRNERCNIDSVHPAHDDDIDLQNNNKRLIRVCPKCTGPLIPLRRRRARCPKCFWEGSADPKHDSKPKRK